MGYEELTIHAIQNKKERSFVERYRLFTSKGDRDKTYDFMVKEQHAQVADHSPVTLKIIVKTEDVQLDMFDGKRAEGT